MKKLVDDDLGPERGGLQQEICVEGEPPVG